MSDTHNRYYCPICMTSEAKQFGTISDKPHAVQCRICGLGIELELKLSSDDYKVSNYDVKRNAGHGDDRWARFHHDSAVAADRLSQLAEIAAFPESGVWLDIGCGNAAMLVELRRRGWSVHGVEADLEGCSQVAAMTAVPTMTFEQWVGLAIARKITDPGVPMVVSFFDSLEHLLDPVGALQFASAILPPAGYLVVEVPDLEDGIKDFDKWKHRRNNSFTEHIWHFSSRSLEQAGEKLLNVQRVMVKRPVPGRVQVIWQKMTRQTAIQPEIATESEQTGSILEPITIVSRPPSPLSGTIHSV